MDITRWSTPKSDWLYSLQPKRRSSIQSAKTRLGADCGTDHELLIAKFRFKLKKVGKTTGLFRYNINQIPYDCTVEVRNRFKGLDLIECLMNYGQKFVTLYRRQESRPSPRKRLHSMTYKSYSDVIFHWKTVLIRIYMHLSDAYYFKNLFACNDSNINFLEIYAARVTYLPLHRQWFLSIDYIWEFV